jgi:DNA-binding CsgD family transcriptional regulator
MRDRQIALTERQRAVLGLVRQGWSNREIGVKLGITEDGVKAHLSRFYLRFGVNNRVQLLAAMDGKNGEGALDAGAALGTLRVLAGRADARVSAVRSQGTADSPKVGTVREALKEVDVALKLVGELPPETSGPVLDAVRRRLAIAFAALDELE